METLSLPAAFIYILQIDRDDDGLTLDHVQA